ncbi:MAG TPA: XrtA system polysaccharide deacetylase [Vicinamibacterales bacterium]|nr:XrtA system polysaccharide deacetylase [Vicinamibacterales bacterium]
MAGQPTASSGRTPVAADSIVNAMTIDVEDYFQVSAFDAVVSREQWDTFPSRVVANTELLLRLFDDHRVKATFFVLGWVAEKFPSLVKSIAGGGHELASHGYAHRLIYEQTPDAFRADIRRSKRFMEDLSGQRVFGYRAPSYSITKQSLWALDVLVEEGFTYDASIFPIRHDRYGIPDAPRHVHGLKRSAGELTEVPPSTVRIGSMNLPVAGGGYFRLLPYGWTRWGIARINAHERRPAIFYLHPWEIDPDQPRLEAGTVSRFRHYRNLDKTEGRLRRLLTDFRFGRLTDVVPEAARC